MTPQLWLWVAFAAVARAASWDRHAGRGHGALLQAAEQGNCPKQTTQEGPPHDQVDAGAGSALPQLVEYPNRKSDDGWGDYFKQKAARVYYNLVVKEPWKPRNHPLRLNNTHDGVTLTEEQDKTCDNFHYCLEEPVMSNNFLTNMSWWCSRCKADEKMPLVSACSRWSLFCRPCVRGAVNWWKLSMLTPPGVPCDASNNKACLKTKCNLLKCDEEFFSSSQIRKAYLKYFYPQQPKDLEMRQALHEVTEEEVELLPVLNDLKEEMKELECDQIK